MILIFKTRSSHSNITGVSIKGTGVGGEMGMGVDVNNIKYQANQEKKSSTTTGITKS